MYIVANFAYTKKHGFTNSTEKEKERMQTLTHNPTVQLQSRSPEGGAGGSPKTNLHPKEIE